MQDQLYQFETGNCQVNIEPKRFAHPNPMRYDVDIYYGTPEQRQKRQGPCETIRGLLGITAAQKAAQQWIKARQQTAKAK